MFFKMVSTSVKGLKIGQNVFMFSLNENKSKIVMSHESELKPDRVRKVTTMKIQRKIRSDIFTKHPEC